MRANLAKSLGGIAACGYVLLLACRGQLGFYIHPRYHLFAAILSTIGIVFLVIDIVLQLKSGVLTAHHRFKFHHVKFASCLSVLILLAGYLLPPKRYHRAASLKEKILSPPVKQTIAIFLNLRKARRMYRLTAGDLLSTPAKNYRILTILA